MFSLHPFQALDVLSTIMFAISGALLAREQQRNLLCALFYAAFTALGGGTFRDILLSQPVFWLQSPNYLLLTLTIGAVAFYGTALSMFSPGMWLKRLQWGDIIGLATFTVIGAQVVVQLPTFTFNMPLFWLLPSAMGLLTAVGGGFVRDTLGDKGQSYIARHPVYIWASILGGFAYSCLSCISTMAPFAVAIAIVIVIIIAANPRLHKLHSMRLSHITRTN